MANIDKLLPIVSKWCGGYVNDPTDNGGPTNRDITLATFRSVYGQHMTIEDLKRMTDNQWRYILKTRYWDRWRADEIINQSIANILVQWVIGSGIHGIKKPQRILGVKADGIVGPVTLAAVNSADPKVLFDKLWNARKEHFESIVRVNPTQKKYLKGWLNRLNDFKYLE